jgi:hypothetical protein
LEEEECDGEADKPEKGPIILLANAVVQPLAVVVKAIDASIASAAMLACFPNTDLKKS